MDVKIGREIEFIPEFRGNKKEKEPIIMVIKYLTVSERDSWFENKGDDVSLKAMQELAQLCVKEIRNLRVNGEDIKTVDELMNTPGLIPLYKEAVEKMTAVNMETDSKN